MKSPNPGALLVILLALTANSGSAAQTNAAPGKNNLAPINVSADRATYENGQGIYEGRVELKQGNLAIEADKLVIEEQNRQVDRILALGTPAALNQSDGTVHAEANRIEYFVGTGKVILTEKAIIQQHGSEIRGKRIVYDSQQQTVEAEGKSGENAERVNMTLQPRNRENDDNTQNNNTESTGNSNR